MNPGRAHLWDDALGGVRRPGIGGDVEHDSLCLHSDDAHCNAAQPGTPSHHAARPAACVSIQEPLSKRPLTQGSLLGVRGLTVRPAMAALGSSFSPAW